jgi:hypothetical protein
MKGSSSMHRLGIKLTIAAAAAAGFMAFGSASASAQVTVIGQESGAGFTGDLFNGLGGGNYNVASDNEIGLFPFGATFDVSDAIQLPDLFSWTQAADSTWTEIGDNGTLTAWGVPAFTTACGIENTNTCEPVGHFVSPAPWNPLRLGTYVITESDGSVSDQIVVDNPASGGAEVFFYSDPSLVPEPTSLLLLGGGLSGLFYIRRRRSGK